MRSYLILSLIAVALLFGGPAMNQPSVQAQSATPAATASAPIVLTVTKLEDTDDGLCDNDCSLREAIAAAPSGATISFASNLSGTITLIKPLQIAKNLTIKGPVAKQNSLIINTNNAVIAFVIKSKIALEIGDLIVTGNDTSHSEGGGIYNEGGTISVHNTIFRGNRAAISPIHNYDGTVTIANCFFQDNEATGGGAISNMGGTLTITDSTFQANHATAAGAISNANGKVSIFNSTFQGNQAATGAVLNTDGTALIVNSTLQGNGKGSGESVLNFKSSTQTTATMTIKNTIILGRPGGRACRGLIVDGGNNLQFPGVDCGTSIPSKDPMLGPLQDNGGSTPTMALQPGSPAIDAGNNATCATVPANTDQRGAARIVGSACDIGAYEYNANPPMVAPTPSTVEPTSTASSE